MQAIKHWYYLPYILVPCFLDPKLRWLAINFCLMSILVWIWVTYSIHENPVYISDSRSDLVHAVLVVEQLLTTGGGWQDQVGGLHPGVNLGSCEAIDQVSVVTTAGSVSSEFVQKINSRLLLMFSGKPRLAKNLLQNVIR